MRPASTFAYAAVIIVLVVAAAYAVSLGNARPSATTPTSNGAVSPSPQTTKIALPKGVSTVQSLDFQPANITLVIGVNNTVSWTNDDTAPHTVTATSVPSGAARFDSGNLNSGATFTYTFTVPGTYRYGCTYHFWMLGTVVVEN
jgi:plastocyanin